MIDNIEYNTEREKLIIPEYGRHLQKMVNHAVAIADDAERAKVVKAIIDVMGNLQPHLRDVQDFKHKLWDQIFIMSDFKLDTESPYPKPSREELSEKPETLEYPQNFPKYRFYGNNIKRMVDVALSWEEGELREALIMTIANHMKKCFLNWNKDTVDDDVIFKHLLELSDGQINLNDKDIKLATNFQTKNVKRQDHPKAKNTNKRYSNNRNNNKNQPRKRN